MPLASPPSAIPATTAQSQAALIKPRQAKPTPTRITTAAATIHNFGALGHRAAIPMLAAKAPRIYNAGRFRRPAVKQSCRSYIAGLARLSGGSNGRTMSPAIWECGGLPAAVGVPPAATERGLPRVKHRDPAGNEEPEEPVPSLAAAAEQPSPYETSEETNRISALLCNRNPLSQARQGHVPM
jgi:hypothetical protein